ncbi:MAG: hypothetical protein JW837_18865 [Sedimentisphaerales bacterium]|nr:hypothetical protein [Sedimentisphaerales bacterium]
MNQTLIQKRIGKFIVLACLLLLLQTSGLWAAEDIAGEWEMKMEFGGRESFATMIISKKADGSLAGKWGSDELSDVKFENGKLTFVRVVKFGDQEFSMDYSGVLKDGKITGQMSSDRGEFAVNGGRKKPKCPVLGQWDISFNVGERQINARVTISLKPDGTYEGKWDEEGEHVLSNVKFQDEKLMLTRDSKIGEFEFQTTCELAVKGNELMGTMKSDMGDLQVKGKRVGVLLIGKWELTTTSERGTRTRLLTIFSDMTGRYESFGGEIPIQNLKLEGDKVSFIVERGFGDRVFREEFKGKLDGKSLTGQFVSDRGETEVSGKMLKEVLPVIGTWEFTRETPRGTRMSILKIKEDMTATYTVRDNEIAVQDLKVDGNLISFKVIMRFGDNEIPMEFKGKVEGKTLVLEQTTSRGTGEMKGKKMD